MTVTWTLVTTAIVCLMSLLDQKNYVRWMLLGIVLLLLGISVTIMTFFDLWSSVLQNFLIPRPGGGPSGVS